MIKRITQLFPIWAMIFSIVAILWPSYFIPLKSAIIPMLGAVMFGMGMTLHIDDFKRVCLRPRVIGIGIAAQLLIMPLAAWLIAYSFGLNEALTLGLILLGCSPGGTASNVVCYLSKGDVALSISLTATSTVLAVVTTPLLTWLFTGENVDIPALKMCMDITKIILLPVGLGVLCNHLLGHRLSTVKVFFPLFSIFAIVLIIAIIVALNHSKLAHIGLSLSLCIVLHNAVGLFGGYHISRLFGFDRKIARTIALEVGMQNSGLSVALALKYFGAMAALPGALFSIWHNLSGAVLAAIWARQTDDQSPAASS